MTSRLSHWLKKEIIKTIPAVLFFGFAFNLIIFTDRLLLKEYEVRLQLSYLSATIGALIVGKIIVIADTFPFVDAFPNKPLIYNISWKILFYGILTFVFRILEDYIYLVFQHENAAVIYHHLAAKISAPSFWLVQVWVWVLFTVYIIADEFVGVMGKNKVKKILFG